MSLIPLRRNRVKGYRLTYNGIGIYEALKKEMFNKTHTPDAWIEFKNSPECNWLPLPPTYGDNNASYFTEAGYNKFMELTMPIVNEYISAEDIKTEVSKVPANAIVYEDEYQFVIDTNKQEWDHDNHPYSFDNPNIYMRPATEDDVDNMYSWEMESIDKSLQEDPKVQQLIRDDCYQSIKDTQMIMDQDKTIGMFTACMIDNGEWRYIGEIYLIPEYRGQHIGSTILKNEIANYDRIRLQVAYDNENALRLYKSLGFKIVKENKEAKLYIMEYDNTKALQEALSGVKASPVDDNFFIEAVLKAKERNSLKDSEFGIPELRKYPLTDETHINMAVKFFGKAPKKYKLSLAKRILRAAHSHDMDTDGWDTINDYIKNHKESVVQEAAYKKGINKANVHPVMIVYKRFSTKKKAQLVPIGKMWDIANKYFPNSTDLSGFGWDWTGWETDFAYGIIINNKQIPDGFMDELKKEFPDIKLDKNFLIPKTYEETYDCTESNMNEVYDKIWAKGFLECELEEYPAEGKMKISVIYQKDKEQLKNELSKHIKEVSTIQEGFFEVGFGNLRKTIADKLGKFVTVTNVQNPTGKEAKFVIKSNEHPEDYVNVIAMGNGVKAYGYKDSERVSIFNNASLSAAIQKLIDSVCDLFDIQKPINESYTERKNFIMKEQITKILEAYNSGVLTQEEASTKIEAIQEAYVPKSDAENNKVEEVKESTTMNNLRVKQDKIMESFKMGIINATEGMRLIERVMMEADYIAEEEDTAHEGDDDNEPEDITPEDTDGDTVDSDDTNIDALADYINSLSDDEKTALMSKLSGSDEPTDDDANGNEEVPTDDTAAEGEPTTEETVDPASASDASLNDANASLDDMEV